MIRHSIAPTLCSILMGCSEYNFVPDAKEASEPPRIDTAETGIIEPLVCFYQDSFTQLEGTDYYYDIFLIVDGSGSMYDNAERVLEWLGNVPDQLLEKTSRNVQLFAVSIDPTTVFNYSRGPFDETVSASDLQEWYGSLPQYQFEQGFEAFRTYITHPYVQLFLHPDAYVDTIVISDEEEQSEFIYGLSVEDFATMYETFGNERSFHSIVHTTSSSSCWDSGSMLGTRYMEATDSIGGESIDICSENSWSPVFRDLPEQIDPYDSWPLTYTPLEGTILVTSNGQGLSSSQWKYDSADQKIIFTTLPTAYAKVTMTYQIDPKTIDQCPEF